MSAAARLPPEQTARVTRRMARLSVAVALVLIAMKGGAWLGSGSVALLSSLADSALDLAASLFTLFAVAYAAAPPDREHRFGHGKAEAFAGLFQAGLVAVSGVLIAAEAIRRLIDPAPVRHGEEAITVMIVSILLTGGLIWLQGRAVKQTGSIATAGDRAHYAADLGANLVVIAGLFAAAFLNWPRADAAAGLIVAAWLGHGAWDVAKIAADHLMDRELPEADRAAIRELAMADGGILEVHDLRTRMSGPYVHVQFHADIDPAISLDQAHKIMVAAEHRIRARYQGADLLIHPDPRGRAEAHGHDFFAEGRHAAGG